MIEDTNKIANEMFTSNSEMLYCEAYSEIFTSNRLHTLLFQRIRKKSGSSSPKIEITEPSKMSKFTFLNVFDSHKPEEVEKLDRLFQDCKGSLPSRRQLSAIAQSIGIQQSKIKKWFDKRNQEQQGNVECENSTLKIEENECFWNEINEKLDHIDDQILEIKINIRE